MDFHASLFYHYSEFLPGFRCLIPIQIPAGLQIHKTEQRLHCENCLKLFCKNLHGGNCLCFHQSENFPLLTFMGSVSIIKALLFFSSFTPNLTFPSSGGFCCYKEHLYTSLINAFSLRFLLCLTHVIGEQITAVSLKSRIHTDPGHRHREH